MAELTVEVMGGGAEEEPPDEEDELESPELVNWFLLMAILSSFWLRRWV